MLRRATRIHDAAIRAAIHTRLAELLSLVDEPDDEPPAPWLEPVSPSTALLEPVLPSTPLGGLAPPIWNDGGFTTPEAEAEDPSPAPRSHDRVRVSGIELFDRLTVVLGSQFGLFTVEQFVSCGGTTRRLQSWGDRHLVRRVLRNVWMLCGVPVTWETRLLAHCFASGGMASHRAAARLLGSRDFADAAREISVPRDRNYRTDAIIPHQSRDLDRIEPVFVGPIPCTPPERTLLDLGQVVPGTVVEEAVDEMLRMGLVTWETLVDCWLAHARKGRPGVKVLGALIDARREESDQPDSRPERHLLRLLLEHGITDGVLHHSILDDHGDLVLEGDVSWPPEKVVVFYDSREHHSGPTADHRDAAKRRKAELLGWTVLPYGARVLYRTPWVIPAEVRQALGRPPDDPVS